MAESLNPQWMRGSFDLIVLSVLADSPQYGYLIQQKLRESSGRMVRLPAGTLYPILHRLEEDGFIRSKWDDASGRRRKWYELTRAGRKQLATQARQWSEYAACISRLIEPVLLRGPSPA